LNEERSAFNIVSTFIRNSSDSSDSKFTLKSPPKIIGNLSCPLPRIAAPLRLYTSKELWMKYIISSMLWFGEILEPKLWALGPKAYVDTRRYRYECRTMRKPIMVSDADTEQSSNIFRMKNPQAAAEDNINQVKELIIKQQ
ncbi:hypothetical protein PV327_011351, partial [Microctonus hyperodae]